MRCEFYSFQTVWHSLVQRASRRTSPQRGAVPVQDLARPFACEALHSGPPYLFSQTISLNSMPQEEVWKGSFCHGVEPSYQEASWAMHAARAARSAASSAPQAVLTTGRPWLCPVPQLRALKLGRFASVLLAREHDSGQLVALKALPRLVCPLQPATKAALQVPKPSAAPAPASRH